ncbi:hypothetical protein KAFR_0I01030 [Kazachstania africana CBS 2517]|uniref:Uncharacterized protein n=1 Tax=Kazachstania africana (strain ATCC 22294 / BCRC 22015 / CBS 2517 / CECT 1963 / NBRC 1671 / NRRL Y-8276) TaxID=1071382 RepID=H2AZT4_KAZAF|nr:hypothetical protein KAFR_0I01030 [Kazachstania africana CBS 2517]CCF59884.1 hypothetical protein KAFR_0I01030 [Kazachstania africana CBS 2517]
MAALVENGKDYYDILAGLSAFERSHEVSFTLEELKELVKPKKDDEKKKLQEGSKKSSKRITVHGYLGGKVDLTEASNANYDLSHTLLGGYVPKKQLESLSSIDFAHYFHKSLDCEDALKIYDLFISSYNGNRINKMGSTGLANGSLSRLSTDGKPLRKVLVCKKCHSKFYGINRMKQLKKHDCKQN